MNGRTLAKVFGKTRRAFSWSLRFNVESPDAGSSRIRECNGLYQIVTVLIGGQLQVQKLTRRSNCKTVKSRDTNATLVEGNSTNSSTNFYLSHYFNLY